MAATMKTPKSKEMIKRAEIARRQAMPFAGSGSPMEETTMRIFIRSCNRAGLNPETWEGMSQEEWASLPKA